ncbi:hypothetical protein Ga0100231_015165 [Opitutaceae bacterium TAV4]|nr:hypothetical protein Ga0100231_015165 [Opitutaceae bacterium TAV4]RRJ99624.1 hypothetical protein Ga0100230_016005 [Opitutaceae bacterium TAV3]
MKSFLLTFADARHLNVKTHLKMPRMMLSGSLALTLLFAGIFTTPVSGADYDYIGTGNWTSWTSALTKWQLSGTTTTPSAYPGTNDDVYLNWQDGNHKTYADVAGLSYGMQIGTRTINNLYANPNGLGGALQLYSGNSSVVFTISGTLYVTASAATARAFTIRGDSGGNPSLAAGNITLSGTDDYRVDFRLGEYNASSRALTNVTVSGATTIGNAFLRITDVRGTITLGELNMTHTGAEVKLMGAYTGNTTFAGRTINLSGLSSENSHGKIYVQETVVNPGITQTAILNINTLGSYSYSYSGSLKNGNEANPGSGTTSLSIIKDGSGVQKLTGNNNTYTGTTEIRAGVLLASNTDSAASATGTGDVTVKTGGTLGGTGYIAGTVTTESNGRLAPGDTGAAGTLTINNTLTLAGSTVLDFDLATANVAGGAGGNDFIQVHGDLALGSSVTLSAIVGGGSLGDGKYTLLGYTGSLSGAENLNTWSLSGLILAADQSAIFGSDSSTVFLQLSTAAIPEPAAWAAIVGLILFACAAVRRRVRRC